MLTTLGTLMQASEAQRDEFRSKRLGFVFQFHHLLPDLPALENVIMPAACAAGRGTRAMRHGSCSTARLPLNINQMMLMLR